MKGYYQLIEGHRGEFKFVLRAGNHETILESGLYWSRIAAMDAVDTVRRCSQDLNLYRRTDCPDGQFGFELLDESGKVLGRSPGCSTRSGVNAGIASVQRNAVATAFRGLVRQALTA